MIFAFEDFELDEDRLELRTHDTRVEIQPKPLSLLFHLIRNRERMVGKRELLDRVWPGVIVTESALSSALRDVRRALGDAGAQPRLIETLRGRGYRFIAPVQERPTRFDPLADSGGEQAIRSNAATQSSFTAAARDGQACRPAIAVLPFDCFGRWDQDGYLADGLAEDLITRLANSLLPVVARTSSFAYRSDARNIREIGDELDAQYIVEGSVRRIGQRIRLTVQLIDVSTGKHVWAELFDRTMGDLFELQDEIVLEIIRSMGVSLKSHLGAEAVRKAPSSVGAWDAYLQASWHAERSDPENVDASIAAAQLAVKLDPEFSEAWATLSLTRCRAVGLHQRQPPDTTLEDALHAASRALELAPVQYSAHLAMGFARYLSGDPKRSEESLLRAVELEPDWPDAHGLLGLVLATSGAPARALSAIDRCLSLFPNARLPTGPLIYRANALFALARDDEALEQIDDILKTHHDALLYPLRAAVLAYLGRIDEAEQQIADIPAFRRRQMQGLLAVWDAAILDRLFEGLRLAGVPA
jgi:TolB-like protein/Flp pilus assembly protein TadD